MPRQTDNRLLELSRWCADELNQVAGHPIQKNLEAVSGDASYRRYFRAHSDEAAQMPDAKTWIAVDAPPEHEDCRPFVAIANSWQRQGLRTPGVLSVDYGRGYMLLEDFGNEVLQFSLDDKTVSHFYDKALADLRLLQQTRIRMNIPCRCMIQPCCVGEMELFPEWLPQTVIGNDNWACGAGIAGCIV